MLLSQSVLGGSIVILRPLTKDDYENLFAVASDPFIWEQHPAHDRWKPEVFRQFFDEAIEGKLAFVILDRKTNEVIGSSRYKVLTEDAIEIGWTFLARKYWGGVYNKEVKRLMIDNAFEHGYQMVVLNIGANNMRSRKAAEKIGAQLVPEGEMPEIRSPLPNYVSYIIRREDWSAIKEKVFS